MNIPKKLNPRYGIPLSSTPVVFGYRHANESTENFTILEGEMASVQLDQVGSISRLRVVPKDEWEQNGFFITVWEGVKVVVQKFDKTSLVLAKEERDRKSLEESTIDTAGDLSKKLELALNRIADLEAKQSKNADNDKIADDAKQEATDKETAASLKAADIDVSAMAESSEKAKTSKAKPKPRASAAKNNARK